MKKLMFLGAAIVLLAAACNSTPTTSTDTSTRQDKVQNDSQTKVDTAVNGIYSGVDSEQSLTSQSDDSVINYDKTIINSYDGVSNANY